MKHVKVNTGLVNDEFVGTVQLLLQEAVAMSGPKGGALATLQFDVFSGDRDDEQGQLALTQAMAMMVIKAQGEELDNLKKILTGQITVDTSLVTDF